ncbi:hypothetical protein [Aeromonas bivalvium]|uniref:hypothetical protein n=1 Tax=Aeromonas bivalvium TaxID=440079 RepID=UPI0038CF59A1
MSQPLEITLPSRREFERSLAEHKRLDLYQIADMCRAFDALIQWQIDPRPRNWNSRHGSLQCLPDNLRGPLKEVKETFYALQKFSRPAAVPYSPEETWQQWGHITL